MFGFSIHAIYYTLIVRENICTFIIWNLSTLWENFGKWILSVTLKTTSYELLCTPNSWKNILAEVLEDFYGYARQQELLLLLLVVKSISLFLFVGVKNTYHPYDIRVKDVVTNCNGDAQTRNITYYVESFLFFSSSKYV